MNVYKGFSTKAIHVGQDPKQWNHHALIPPIVMSTTFQQDSPGKHNVRQTERPCLNLFLTLCLQLMIDNNYSFYSAININFN